MPLLGDMGWENRCEGTMPLLGDVGWGNRCEGTMPLLEDMWGNHCEGVMLSKGSMGWGERSMNSRRTHAATRSRSGSTVYRSAPRSRRAGGSVPLTSGPRRFVRLIAALALLVVVMAGVVSRLQHASPGTGLPLSDAAVIREQATDKHVDPSLIAAVIYAESKFEPRTSSAGALGLMQIEPATAEYIAHLSGGVRFTTGDLATPKINVAYGSWYLRYLLHHYEGNAMLAIAAYNAGLANVDAWVAKAHSEGTTLRIADIPFPETRAYVERVMRARVEYRAAYPRALGLT
jgi:soluble lytic murein transglycosylase